jgi:PqqD family protein of HPr-rel-A system
MWRVISGQQLVCRSWDDEFVLYNNLSGDTHLLDSDAVDLLMALRAAPATAPKLAEALGADAADPATADAVAALLRDLAGLHLVETVPC